MKRLPFMRWISSRLHLAMGLAALAVGVVLGASYLQLIPDGEAMTRQHRGALAETIAISVSSQLNEAQPEDLQATLQFLRARNPDLLSIGVRSQTGELLIDVQGHAAHWAPGPRGASTDAEIFVPVWQAGQAWGQLELRFKPLRSPGWKALLDDPSLRLTAFMFMLCTLLFFLYLRRMLRELDPSRAVPQRVRTAYDTLTEGLIVVDAEGSIVLANKSTGAMLGVDENSLVGHSPSEFAWSLQDGQQMGGAALPWQTALTTRQAQRDVHLNVVRHDGARFSLRANCSPILDERGALQAVVISFQDVTELEQRGEALRAARDQADAANEAKSQFLANMSHEIRTPMNAILGFTELLRRSGRHSGEAAKHLDIVHSSGKHLLNLINDILDLSKVEAGRLEAEQLRFAPHLVAREVVHTLAERAQQRGLSLQLVFPQALPAQITSDPVRLRQILTNLIGNAIKFTEQGGVRVVMRTEGKGAAMRYCIDVEDSGIGIPADKLDTVFEPFVQAEASTTRRFGGTGLGLTISRGFARAMGGDIVARSVYGQGTTFCVSLDPGDLQGTALLDPEILDAVEEGSDNPAVDLRWTFSSGHVLVVDDGPENRHLVRVLLEEAGLKVSEAENGQVAVDMLGHTAVDLVLMDIQMPVMDGYAATRRLRADGFGLPILALTANAMKGFEHALNEAGFSGYLTKPIEIQNLMSELGSRLGGQAVPASAVEAASGSAGSPVAAPVAAPSDATPAAVELEEASVITSRLSGHAKLGKIVKRFVEQLPSKLEQMDRAAADADMDELAALAHWLKGAGGSMGFDALFEPAKALEDAAHTRDPRAAAATLIELHAIKRAILRGGQAPQPELIEAAP